MLPAERVKTYHDQSTTARERVCSRRQRRVDVVDSSPTSTASVLISSGWRNRNPWVGNDLDISHSYS